MAIQKTPGLFKRGTIWHIDKQCLGFRLRRSTHSASLSEANRYLARLVEETRQAKLYGQRPKRSFREAALQYCQTQHAKRSFQEDVRGLKLLDRFMGELPLDAIHRGTLLPFIETRRQQGVKNATINHSLQLVRRILNLAAGEWVDDYGLTWLHHAPKITLLPVNDARAPYPLSWEEETRLLNALPSHLKNMARFAVNTGCRAHELCVLRWEWEKAVPLLKTSVFIIPKDHVKNSCDRLVVLNHVAHAVITSLRGQHPDYVFTYRGKPLQRMLNSGWKRARQHATLPHLRVHDLKHTFGRRLRAAGVSFEDRQDLLGHKSTRITTHYCASELQNLLAAANKAVDVEAAFSAPTLTGLKGSAF